MKILVVSDSHGNINGLMGSLGKEEFDMLFYLGDYVKDGIRISEILNIPYKIVRGNGDWNVTGFSDDEVFYLDGKKIFLTHGHNYNVSRGIDKIYYKAKEIGADYAFFGHTHVPLIENVDDIIIMNPGSPTLPRTGYSKKSFGVVEIGENKSEKIIKIK